MLFHDLSLLSSSAAGDDNSSSRLLLSARALELGYAAAALDHSHRGILASSHCCRTQPFAALSSLPLPTSPALHRRRLASPTSEPFRQYTRITLSIDSPAAAASALATSAARLLRTYDIVAARPLTQAAFDHLCQVPYTQQLDLVSIDFSHKLPFRLKLPMLKLAMQRGLRFEITYSPFIATDGDKHNLADAKLLVEWTKGKNLVISSAAHSATQIRGPYDVINLCSYLLGIPICRAKAAISTNPRSLISMALRKKHFYKETIRIERLLPHEKLDSTKFVLSDWIGWNSESCKGDLRSSETGQVETSSNKDQRPSSPIYGVIQVSHGDSDVSVVAKQPEQPTNDDEIQDETVQADILTDPGLPILPTSLDHQDSGPCKPGNDGDALECSVQAASGPSGYLNSTDKPVEFDQDAMEIDATESCKWNLIGGDNVPSTSEASIKLIHYAHHQGSGHSVTSLEDKSHSKTAETLDDVKPYAQYPTDCVLNDREKAPLASISDVCIVDTDMDQSTDIPADSGAYSGTLKPVECPQVGKNIEEHIDQIIDEEIELTAEGEVESTVLKTRKDISVESLLSQEVRSTGYANNKGSSVANCGSDELKQQSSEETIASLQKNIADTHELSLNCPYPSSEVEISTVKSEKRRIKLRSLHSAYLPFLGFLRSGYLKRKVCRKRNLVNLTLNL